MSESVELASLRRRADRLEQRLDAIAEALQSIEQKLTRGAREHEALDSRLSTERLIRAKVQSRVDHLERATQGLLEHAEKLRFVVSQHERRLDALAPQAPPGGVQ